MESDFLDPALNPFNPGSGTRPPHLTGREAEVSSFETLIVRAARRLPVRGMMFSGLRGVGKTVLLNRMRSIAQQNKWLTISLEAHRSVHFAESLGRHLYQVGRQLERGNNGKHVSASLRDALSTIKSFNIGVGVSGVTFNIELDKTIRAQSGDIRTDLMEIIEDLSPLLVEQNTTLSIFIDELQDLDSTSLEALLAVQHRANQEEWPFVLMGAGLPTLPSKLASCASYSERMFDTHLIGPLSDEDTYEALRTPIEDGGGSISAGALGLLAAASGGYPYFIQEFGSAAWSNASSSHISTDDAKAAVLTAEAILDAGFFPARWDRATKKEKDLLKAMSIDGDGPSSLQSLVERMGRTKSSSLSVTRKGLIDKGIVYSPAHGQLAFTVPGMTAFIRRNSER